MHTVTLEVDGMKCDGCVAAVRSALEAIEEVKEVNVSLADGSATVHMEPAVDRDLLIEAVSGAGYRTA